MRHFSFTDAMLNQAIVPGILPGIQPGMIRGLTVH